MLEKITDYWTTWACGLLAAALGLFAKWTHKQIKKLQANDTATMALLHDRLYQGCMFYLQRGWVDAYGLENIGKLYAAYHDMGGNGTGTKLYERVAALPVKEGVLK